MKVKEMKRLSNFVVWIQNLFNFVVSIQNLFLLSIRLSTLEYHTKVKEMKQLFESSGFFFLHFYFGFCEADMFWKPKLELICRRNLYALKLICFTCYNYHCLWNHLLLSNLYVNLCYEQTYNYNCMLWTLLYPPVMLFCVCYELLCIYQLCCFVYAMNSSRS
jgi:hypothetical protein